MSKRTLEDSQASTMSLVIFSERGSGSKRRGSRTHPKRDVMSSSSSLGGASIRLRHRPRITVSVPGDSANDLMCSNTSDTAYMNNFRGASAATPKVAGTAALMLAVDPMLTRQEITSILRDTGSAVITDSTKPVGTLLNSGAAVKTASSNEPIIAKYSGKVLDVRDVLTANGAQIQQWDYSRGDNQRSKL
jgi:subtilisin family serine protease